MKAEDILSAVLRRYEELLAGTDTGVRTLAEAQRLSGKLGKSLGRILAEELLRAFPEGAVSEEAAMAVIPPALRRNSDVVSGFVREIQKRLNEAARVPAPTGTRFRAERAENLARYAAGQESFESAADTFSQLVETNSRMVVDDAVRDQAKAHYGMGLSPKIIRKAAPGCCPWCTAHAGTVAYGPGMDKEIFRRHKNCPCLIEYDPGNGAKDRQRVENYRFSQGREPLLKRDDSAIMDAKMEMRKAIIRQVQEKRSSAPLYDAITKEPGILTAYSPKELLGLLESVGYVVTPLGHGHLKGIPFDEGGGYRTHFGGNGYLQYHPAEKSRHGGAYWKISSEKGVKRYDMDGNEKD